jgi:hypothetical protein
MGFFGGGGGAASNMVGATSSVAGTAGLVPAPAAGKNTRALFSDASFGELPLLPAYKNTTASHWIGPYLPSRSDASAAPTAKVRVFIPVFVPSDGNIDALGCITGNAPSTAYNIHLALWECAEDGTPSTYVTGGTASSGTAGSTVISISVSSTPVKRGFYYASFTPDANVTGNLRSTARSSYLILGSFLGSSAGPVGQTGAPNNWTYTATTYNQTTHETLTLAGGDPVNIGFQYV